jgi:amino acid adenylation domain-containing protein
MHSRSAQRLQTPPSFLDRLDEVCKRQKDEPAVLIDATVTTYATLDRAARSIAAAIERRVPDPRAIVAIRARRDVASFAALLGILRAGRAFVATDPDYPDERNELVLDDASPALVLIGRDDDPRHAGARPHAYIETLIDDDAPLPARRLEAAPPDALACLVYTSGSTGRPKAAMVPFVALAQMARIQHERIGVRAGDRHTLLQSMTTIGGLRSLFGALASGACVCPYELPRLGVRPLRDWLARRRITVLHCPATVMRHIAQSEPPSPRWSSVMRLVVFGAERVFWDDVAIARRLFGEDVAIWTGLGSSEAGTLTGWHVPSPAPERSGLVPLGRAVDGVRLRLVDEQGREVPEGEAGRIEVRSPFVALGYWRSAGEPDGGFDAQPDGQRRYCSGDLARRLPDGMLLHVGRSDFVVKIRGVRIDLGELEAAFARDPAIVECAVVCETPQNGDPQLHAFIEPAAGANLTDARLREIATRALLPAMRPAHYWIVREWPRTLNGKLNRRALRDWPHRSAPPRADAMTADLACADIERVIAECWQRARPGQAIGRTDDFFACGGTSLTAIEVCGDISARLNRPCPVDLLFRAPTIAGLASLIANDTRGAQDGFVVTLQEHGQATPLYCICGVQLYAELASRLAPHVPVHAVFLPWESRMLDGAVATPPSVPEIAAGYVAAIRRHRPTGPYALLGISFGGILAYEVARQLDAVGERVNLLALLDCLRPGGRIVPLHRQPLAWLRRLRVRHAPPPRPPEGASPAPVLTECERAMDDLRMSLYRRARIHYTATRWNGRAMLFRAQHTFRFATLAGECAYGWDRVIPRIEVHDVPGDHLGILRQPGVDEIARLLRSRAGS